VDTSNDPSMRAVVSVAGGPVRGVRGCGCRSASPQWPPTTLATCCYHHDRAIGTTLLGAYIAATDTN
ncbi:MAG: hypothetical protein LC749_04980, partial [Actinobacteria bacterium]|nr:hypothetical protein [Actinomycetota bacterium]